MAPNSRRTAAFILARWLATKDFPAAMLPEGRDRAFVQDLVYTAIRRLRPLRKTLGALMRQWPKGELEALLYVGAAQIFYMPEVPDFASVSETVDAAKECANPNVAGVVNGVLRNMVRRKGEFEFMLAAMPMEERESFPTALVRRWRERFGDENALRLCQWHNEPAETFIARRDGSFTRLERGKRVEDVPGYDEGEFIVQDPGTRLAVELLDPKPGERVLDACAAPGGKTVQIAWRGADVTACEVNPRRRALLAGNLKRLALQVRVVPSLDIAGETFRKVLVDAPCSNTGVLRRRPDARWRWTEERLKDLVSQQDAILSAAAAHVAPGGRLVYSTCSNEPEENGERIAAFLAAHSDFIEEARRESVPHESGHDGAFACALVKSFSTLPSCRFGV